MTQYLPPEWHAQSAVMLTWPHAHGDWAVRLAQVEPVFVGIAREVAQRQRVLIGVYDAAYEEHVRGVLHAAGVPLSRADFVVVPSNDTWARDHGPLTVLRGGKPVLLDFQFNGWGGKFAAELDNGITAALHAAGAFGAAPRERMELVLEGGSLEVDGQGTLLTTSRCLLAPTRNPHLSRADVERELGRLLGTERVLWLENGYLAGDDTDSHIDTLARFCDPHTIAYVACDDRGDEHYAELKAMETELRGFRAYDGRPYRLVPLPWPDAKYDEEGQRLPATYANFLIINGAVLVPTYGDAADGDALRRLQTCFPDRQIVAVPCMPLIHQFGSLHCVTMQLPAELQS